ncbi:Vacuolar -sorting-associated 25 [Hyphodiscus hymeniophilus]|uniref:Vacuolar protein-sorting-associated protein 25 n=1 Tax=Hyphodiscus hymeniophilus TaxID=353542 RepID=A0A9P7AYD1_9HELO|nr:Vacuolar -sorting-associated 25 [Hyphodiscus hymeniophilus]
MSLSYPLSLASSGTTLVPSSVSTTTRTGKPISDSETFTYPREYNFPPFFTLQRISSTSHAQSQKWSSLIQSYCRFHRLFKLSLIDAVSSPLFHNARINKRLELNDAREMVEFMRKEGRAEWIGSGKGDERRNTAWIWWRNPEEWANAIAEWVEETGQKNTVLTLYELTESDITVSQEFHGMDPEVLQKALSTLVKRGKAQVFGQEDQQGVKFF